MRKKALTYLLCAGMALSMVACGKDSDEQKDNEQSTPTPKQEENNDNENKGSEDPGDASQGSEDPGDASQGSELSKQVPGQTLRSFDIFSGIYFPLSSYGTAGFWRHSSRLYTRRTVRRVEKFQVIYVRLSRSSIFYGNHRQRHSRRSCRCSRSALDMS